MRKVLVIGTGGIGSFLIPLLDKVGMYSITVSDPDSVEKKNITYQNFSEEEVGELKVMAMQKRYTLSPNKFPILTEQQLRGYDLVICCVDNIGLRRTMYNCKDLKWLDLRAQGRTAAMIAYTADPIMYDSLLAGEERSFSCQGGNWSGKQKDIHYTHTAVAGMATQWMQRWFNTEEVCDFKIINI